MRILLIEDEKNLARLIKRGLEEEKFIVDIVYDGESGVDFAKNNEYDLIIADIMIPKLDGFGVVQKLRVNEIKTPIIILTAKDSLKDKIRGLETGADDYVTKPFEFEELLARIRAVIRRNKEIRSSAVNIGDIYVDFGKGFVKKGDREIRLSPKEYALLRYLVLNKGRVVSREKIINALYDFEELNSNAVEVLVNRLRSKIDQEHRYIKTVKGLGYIFDYED